MKRVRILPMSHLDDQDFKNMSIEEVQNNFFMHDLKIIREFDNVIIPRGTYLFKSAGINSDDGDLILFQMDGMIIASAIYQLSITYPATRRKVIDGVTYKGEIFFYEDTIKIFEPITLDEMIEIIPEFKGFKQSKYDFNLTDEQYCLLEKRINK